MEDIYFDTHNWGPPIVFRPVDLSVCEYLKGSLNADGSLSVPAEVFDFVLYGAYLPASPGLYEFCVDIGCEDSREDGGELCEFDLYDHGKTIAAIALRGALTFRSWVPHARGLELRFRALGRQFRVNSLSLVKIPQPPSVIDGGDGKVAARTNSPTQSQILDQLWSALHEGTPRAVVAALAARAAELDVNVDAYASESRKVSVVEVFDSPNLERSRSALRVAGLNPVAVADCVRDDLNFEAELARNLQRPELAVRLTGWVGEATKDVFKDQFLNDFAARHGAHQFSALAAGVVFCPCPFTNAPLESSHSLTVTIDGLKTSYIFYRFEGLEPFYVVAAGFGARKSFLYLPRHDLALQLSEPRFEWGTPQAPIEALKRAMLSHPLAVHDYLHADTRRAVLMGAVNNMGHFFWNDLSGVMRFQKLGLLHDLPCALVYRYCFIDPTGALERPEAVEIFRTASEDELFLTALERHLFCVRPTAMRVEPELAQLLRRRAELSLSDAARQRLEAARSADLLIWFNLRTHNKVWLEQAMGASAVAKRAQRDGRSIALYLDGTPDCAKIAEEISALVPPETLLFDGFSVTVDESIAWAFTCDAYVATVGSGLTLVTWIAAKPGVAHSERAHRQQVEFWREVRLDALPPDAPPKEAIIDRGEGAYCNYSVEPELIAERLFALLPPRLGTP